jgi:hypothetical protein
MRVEQEQIGIYDVLSEALYRRLPMEHQTYDEDYSMSSLRRIKLYCKGCVGKRAIFYHVDGRKEAEPKLVEITGMYPYFLTGRYRCYDPEGEFRCYLGVSIGYADLYCGSSRLEILGDI